ncbi:SDR family oxidoreductase [Asticcacaulis sp. EMRT-3]|uniref:SDR family NAD(P)-dependent oxidoreductase n=1 Tax=Asticcacaulis sp. EMRT-3 TaxID=3040349 RepID=UPI0024AED1A6|nr:SDR family oxidoreductase [Asticcacaulis sp. EMRT-3]MDI7773850.1 SDR family oxidoreductase [Asticcacaulis sp. EMRT-3]
MLASRTFLITGASSGLGEEFARQYAQQGHNLVLVARRLNRLEDLAHDLIDRHKVQVTCLAADLAQRDQVQQILHELSARHLAINGLVNNAGYSLAHTFRHTSAQAQVDFLEVCVTAPTLLAHELLPHMLQQGWGRIINVSSMVAFSPGAAGHTLYPAAKSYMLKFSRSLAAEVAARGVNVTALCPGTTDSEFQQANGMTKVLGKKPARLSMHVTPVVRAAIHANEAGREVVITGLLNQIAVAAMTLLPDFLITPLIRWGARKYQMPE